MDDYLVIYTDGSSAPKPRKGGVGFRILFLDGTYKDFLPNGYWGATNNEMELQACILALKEVLKINDLRGYKGINICTDSQYIVDHYKNAMFNWPKQKWIRSNGEPVLNAQQWKELIRLMKRIGDTFHLCVNFEKVKAHCGIEDNEAVDGLAKSSRKTAFRSNKISEHNVRRSKFKNKTVRGSIKGEGQRIRIHIVTSSYLKVQKIFRVKAEVVSEKNKYFGGTDFILSESLMRAGHVYDVILKDGLDHCSIEKIVREIKKE